MAIEIKTTNCETMSWKDLKEYEFNALKNKDGRNVSKLKNSIVNNGFNSPFYIWNDHRFVIDGTGRQLALLELEKEGYNIPDLPIVKIIASTKKEALKIVMQVSSQHGEVTQESLKEFTIEFDDLELEELQINELEFNLYQNTEVLEKEEDINFDDIKSNSDREKKFKDQLVCCPTCETKFNVQI